MTHVEDALTSPINPASPADPASPPSPADPATSNHAAFARAIGVLPGGVSSPVRAYGSVGGVPRFIASARGAYVTDVAGREYLDLVDSWGPAGRDSDPATAAANNRGTREERPETTVPAADIRVLQCIAGDAWWSPENEREADSQRWLLQRGLIVEDGQRGLALTPEGRRLI